MNLDPVKPTLARAVERALRAPSVHNTQPWRWRIGDRRVDLFVDRGRQLVATDPGGRDALISCGAALHHLRVALAHSGLATRTARMPDPEDRLNLATVTVTEGAFDATDAALFGAIARRHTDRRRLSHRPVPPELVRLLATAAGRECALLVPVEHAGRRDELLAALAEAARRQRWHPGYAAELELWTRRPAGARDGVPLSAIAHPPAGLSAAPSGLRPFPHAGLSQPLPPYGPPDDAAEFLVLATDVDDEAAQLRAGEALSAVLLTATREGLATTPLSQGTESDRARAAVRAAVRIPEHPQIIIRVGWPATRATELSTTPRRDLRSVLLPTG